ncbi:hypothetical protein K9N50_02690 [bacterium]|nr:hypothetical protein [bacterium]
MFIADTKNHIIHDMSFVRFECKIRELKEEDKKKIFNITTVKRMIGSDHVPQYNGCPYCMSEYHNFDFNKLFS